MLHTWSEWLGEIELEVRDLRAVSEIYREVRKIVQENPSIPSQNVFHRWMRGLYVAFGVVGVARLVDERKDTRSLVRLLHEIAGNASVLSRERYVAAFIAHPGIASIKKNHAELFANRHFDTHVGVNSRGLTKAQVHRDINYLLTRTRHIVRFRHDHLAHLAAKRAPSSFTISELDTYIALIGGLFNKYSALVRMHEDYEQWVPPADWKAIFRVPWIAPRSAGARSDSPLQPRED